MKTQKTTLALAVGAALGIAALAPATASAAQLVPNGEYRLVINPTPIVTTYSGASFFKVGKDGNWNSTFTFGGIAPGSSSQGMTDNNTSVASPAGNRGSSVGGDGYAGSIVIDVTGNTFTVKSFNVDAIPNTAGGTFVEYTDPSKGTGPDTTGVSAMTGTIDGSGNMTFTPTGRLGAISAQPTLYDEAWNINPSASTYQSFSTGTASTQGSGGTVTINGAPVTTAGDLNGDGVTDYKAVLVSGGLVGNAWGGFSGVGYLETWNVELLSGVRANADSATVTSGTASNIDVLNNDTAGTGVSVTVGLGSVSPSHGTVTVTNSGPFTLSSCKPSCAAPIRYTPASSYTGPDSFTYTLTGSDGTTSTGTVSVNVQAAGSAVANPDSATTGQSTPVYINELANDTDSAGNTPPATPVTVNLPSATSTQGGTLSVSTSTATLNEIVYTPPAGFVGTDSFTYTFTDSSGKTSAPATVTVTVNAAFQGGTGVTSVGPGASATAAGTSGLVTTQQLVNAGVPTDSGVAQQCIGGCFDWKAVLSSVGGQVSVAMLPLTQQIPPNATLRKYVNGKWQDFVTSNGDSVASAPGSATVCPAPSSSSYTPGLTAGDYCVRLTITDGGPNDGDGSANGAITDPSGIATGTATTTGGPTDFKGLGSGGCVLDAHSANPLTGGSWWLIGTLVGWMGFRRRKARRQ